MGGGFAAAMARLGPFEPSPRLAVAVSGGADSLALSLLAADWAASRNGDVLALVADHGLRPASRAEALLTLNRLGKLGISAELLLLHDLIPGAGLAARARAARYQALAAACRRSGRLHLLLGHHAADQAETIAMRLLARSVATGLSGMAAMTEGDGIRLLRPLLGVPPAVLREMLVARGIGWIDDPSNHDPVAQRARLRALRDDSAGEGPVTAGLVESARCRAATRGRTDVEVAAELAEHARLYPQGYAVVAAASLSPAAFATVIGMISGAAHRPSAKRVARLAAGLEAGTIGGVRLLPAGRLGPGWLMVRESTAMAPPIAARDGTLWDSRFRLHAPGGLPDGTDLGALGPWSGQPKRAWLPAALQCTLPALRRCGIVVAVPHLGYAAPGWESVCTLRFHPPRPAAGAPFLGDGGSGC